MYAVIDFETIARPIPQELIEAVKDGRFTVDNQLKDPVKIMAKLEEKWCFSPEGAQPIAVGIAMIDPELIDGLNDHVAMGAPFGIQSESTDELGSFLFDKLNEAAVQKIIGYNIQNFDMPILIRLAATGGFSLYRRLKKYDVIDLAFEMPEFNNKIRPLKGKATSSCTLFEVEHSGGSGADVAMMFASDIRDGTKNVLKYCLEDVRATAELFLKLSRVKNFA